MNDTKSEILKIGDELIRQKGFNAFSYYDISKKMGIRHAAIHYHFPTKCDLGMAIIRKYGEGFQMHVQSSNNKPPIQRIKSFLNLFSIPHKERTVCIMGALTPEMSTFDQAMQEALVTQTKDILEWLQGVLEEGFENGSMWYSESPRTRALLILTSMMSSLSITRITGSRDFVSIKNAILNEIILKK